MTCAPLMCFRSTSSNATYLHSRHSGDERWACAQEGSCWRSANWSRLEALCCAQPRVNICQLSTCTLRLHHIRHTSGSLPSRQKPHGMKMLEEEKHGYFVDASSISARLHHTKARTQDASAPFSSLGAKRKRQRRAHSRKGIVDFVSVHFRIVKRKQRLPHAKKESGTGSHHGRGDSVSLFP